MGRSERLAEFFFGKPKESDFKRQNEFMKEFPINSWVYSSPEECFGKTDKGMIYKEPKERLVKVINLCSYKGKWSSDSCGIWSINNLRKMTDKEKQYFNISE